MLKIYFILSQSEIWHNLGVCALKTDPSVSQHALIESLELNSENGQAWTTLGILYLKHGNEQKAHQALRNSFCHFEFEPCSVMSVKDKMFKIVENSKLQ